MPRTFEIACLQTRPMPSMASAIDETLPLAKAAVDSGAQLIFLPEYCGGLCYDGVRLCPPSQSESQHDVLLTFCEFALENRTWLNIGSIAVDGPDGKIINRGYMIDDLGNITGHYDKIHLFDVNLSDKEVFRESDTVLAGDQTRVYDTPFGRIGHTICYDLRFPHLYRGLALAGAEILICPAAFTKQTGEAHWHVLNRARAIENTCFMISPCAVGSTPGGGDTYGHSLIVDPWGTVLADGGDMPGLVLAQIDLDQVHTMASRIPSLCNNLEFSVASPTVRSVA